MAAQTTIRADHEVTSGFENGVQTMDVKTLKIQPWHAAWLLNRKLPALFVVAVAVALPACSSINRQGAIKKVRFLQGVTTKSQVVNGIGLPDSINRNDAKNIEYWLYSDIPTTVDYFLPVTAVLIANAPQYDFGGPLNHIIKQNSQKPIALICGFDAQGTLVEIVRVRKMPQ